MENEFIERATKILDDSGVSLHPLARKTIAELISLALLDSECAAFRAAATHLRNAMEDVERLSPDYTERLHTSDVRRLADELDCLGNPAITIKEVITGCCDDCGNENTRIIRSEYGWQCAPCLLEYLSTD